MRFLDCSNLLVNVQSFSYSRLGCAGRILEIGTGTGVGTAWLLDGMNATSRIISVDIDPQLQAVAREFLGDDPRL